jgi:acetoin utilization protein AcuB
MLASQFLHTGFPSVQLTDKISFALQLMDDYDVQHLPVVNEEKCVGLIAKSDALDADENHPVAALETQLIKVFVKEEDHFLNALKLFADAEITLIPVVNENQEIRGVITSTTLLKNISHFLGTQEPGGLIVLEIDKRHFSFGEISRLVETNDAYITQLNTTLITDTQILVTIKINKAEISDIVATFQRFDYQIRYYFGEEQYANELKENYHHLMAYLNI